MAKRKEPTEEQRERARNLRAQLCADSALARQLIEMGEADSVNEALIEFYTDEVNEEFNTFGQWLKLGMAVKKGEHCRFPVWGEPVDRAKPGTEAQPTPTVQAGAEAEDDATKFWPICKLFSNAQVEAKTPR
ncbi:MAG: hypothetical protein ACRYFX_04580 [Janthinobacterium lividum]